MSHFCHAPSVTSVTLLSRFCHACSVTCAKSLGFLSVTLLSRFCHARTVTFVTLLSRLCHAVSVTCQTPLFFSILGVPFPTEYLLCRTGIPRAPLVRRRVRGRTGIQRARWCAPCTWWCRLQDEHPTTMLITTIFPTAFPILIPWLLILIRTTTSTTSLRGVFWDRGLRPAKRRGDP